MTISAVVIHPADANYLSFLALCVCSATNKPLRKKNKRWDVVEMNVFKQHQTTFVPLVFKFKMNIDLDSYVSLFLLKLLD